MRKFRLEINGSSVCPTLSLEFSQSSIQMAVDYVKRICPLFANEHYYQAYLWGYPIIGDDPTFLTASFTFRREPKVTVEVESWPEQTKELGAV